MEVLEKFKIHPKSKAKMNILLCQMVAMPIVCPTLRIEVMKMEQAFKWVIGRAKGLSMYHHKIGKERLSLWPTLWTLRVHFGSKKMRSLRLF
jgi:hypothetical protein